jgi:hypothetical protein
MFKSLSFLLLLTFISGILWGQSTSASLTGRITDPDRKVIGAATIRATNTGTGIPYQGLTNESGVYYISDLPPGRYRIEVEKVGFKAVIESDVFLHVQDVLEVNFEMMLGSTSESVTVRDSSTPRDTESSSVGTVVERREANELPLNGRNVFNLIVLAPSVIPQGSSFGTPVGVNPFGWANYQVTGAFGNQSAEYLDGQPLNIGYINLPILVPIQDSIQEFKVQTGNLPAEWGRFAGGVTNLSTKGGTQTLHGGVYEYLRNRLFNANDYFLNAVGKPRPGWVQNQFGAQAGGPFRLPACCAQNRIVWFANWEGFSLRTGQPFTATVPTAQEKAGDFSAIDTPVLDPCAGSALNPQGACPQSQSMPAPFAGNILPASRSNPTSKALLYLWPAPNVPGVVTPSGTFNNFNAVGNTGGDQNQAVARMDEELTDKQKIFSRLSYWNVYDLPFDPLADGLCQDRCTEHYATYALVTGYNYGISSKTILDVNGSFSYFRYRRSPTNAGFDLTSIGWPAAFNASIPSVMRTPPTPCVASYADSIMCTQGQSYIQDNDYQYHLTPSITLLRGRHLLHAGFQLETSYDNFAQTNVASGAFDFCGLGEACYTGLSIADFLLGYADNVSNIENHFSAQAVVPEVTYGRQVYRALYANDTWHITDRLALNLGLRYELQGPWSERENRLTYFDPRASSYLDALLPSGSPSVKGDVFLVSPSQRSNLPLRKDDVAPRLGMAYSVTPRTIVRSGYGIYWIPDYISYSINPSNDMVNAASTTFTGTVDGIHPYSSIALPFPNGISPPPGRSLGAVGTQRFLTQVTQSIIEVDRANHPEGYTQQWSLSVERQLPAQFSLVAAYVGSRGTHLPQYSQQIDQISDGLLSQAAAQFASGGRASVRLLDSAPNPFLVHGQALALTAATTTQGQLLRPFPQYINVELAGQGSFDSIYHSLQLSATKRFATGATLTAAYTNAKLISNTDTLTSWLETRVGGIQDNNNLRAERSLSSQDVPQRLVLSYVLDLPFGEGRPFLAHLGENLNRLVGGWGIDGVTTFQRGFPLVFSNGQTNDVTLFGAGSRPDVLPSCAKWRRNAASGLAGWFNTSCFAAPRDFAFGNEPRVDANLRSDGVDNFDLALFKRVSLSQREHLSSEFRVEFFNLFNRVQFAPPDTTCCSSNNPDFGVITSTAPGTNPRLVQFAAKLTF